MSNSGLSRVSAEQIVSPESDKTMEELFRVLKDSSLNNKPLKQRNLPPSFWQQPTCKPAHSREGSTDSVLAGLSRPAGLNPVHGRSHSSPAQLPQCTISLPPASVTAQHIKQNSLGDFVDEPLGPLPPMWEMAKTADGLPYFINHLEQTTSWVDPRKSLSSSTHSVGSVGSPAAGTLSPGGSIIAPGGQGGLVASPSSSMQNLSLGPLPAGWESANTPAGETYFINHIDRTTSWFDPRTITQAVQLVNRSSSPGSKQVLKHSPQQGPPPQITTSLSPHHTTNPPAMSSPPQRPTLATGTAQKQNTASPTRTQGLQSASPTHPGLVSPSAGSPGHTTPTRPTGGGGVLGGGSGQNSEVLVRSQLLLLQQERARLLARQEEIKRQEQLLQELSAGNPVISSSGSDLGGGLGQVCGVDPFLGQTTTSLENHARQNSGDSGLGGMGTSYSLPRTPEDFLSNVDEMDTHDNVVHKLAHTTTDFNLNDIPAPPNMDVSHLTSDASNDATAMDSDDLEPSLQDEIGIDLPEMDVSKMESLLTWL